MISVPLDRSFDDWRLKARDLLVRKTPPEKIQWICESEFPLGAPYEAMPTANADITLPREFINIAYAVSAYRDDTTWDLLYRVAWRLLHEDRKLLHIKVDKDIRELEARHHSVSRDIHKMHAFVRFREVQTADGPVYMAWHRPDHRIARLSAGFFKDRFNGMKWVIMTEDDTVAWDLKTLSFLPGTTARDLPEDAGEDLWKTYYSAIFNPARVKVSMMKKEMAVRYWDTLPESQLIPTLLKDAPERLKTFQENNPPAARVEEFADLGTLNEQLKKCRACGICPQSNGPVMGEGPSQSKLVFVGEQPGDNEDKARRPFIGPAGQILMESFELHGLERKDVYLTNAVKGFKWIKGHIERQHRTANANEIATCRPWLQEELKIIKPETLVLLGRTAAQSVLGKMVKLEDVRGRFFKTPYCDQTIVLPHPSSLLRSDDPLARTRFLEEMKMVTVHSKKIA